VNGSLDAWHRSSPPEQLLDLRNVGLRDREVLVELALTLL
jgi:hypothetical protein